MPNEMNAPVAAPVEVIQPQTMPQTQPGQAMIQNNPVPAKKKKTLLYVLLGCGGCFLLSVIAGIIIFVVAYGKVSDAQNQAKQVIADMCTDINKSSSTVKYFTASTISSEPNFNESLAEVEQLMYGCKEISSVTGLSASTTNEIDKISLQGVLAYSAGKDTKAINVDFQKESGTWKISAIEIK